MIEGNIMSKKNLGAFISVLLITALLLSGCNNSVRKGEIKESSSNTEYQDNSYNSDFETTQATDLEYEYEYVKAVLKDNVLTVTILSSDAAYQYFGTDSGLRYDEPYPVYGLEHNYIDLFIGSVGSDFSPFVFLLTDHGTVDCVPVGNILLDWLIGPREEDLVFTATGELPSVNNAVAFYEGPLSYEGGDYTTVFAVIDHGNDVDLTLPFYYATHPQDAPLSEDEAMEILVRNEQEANPDYLSGQNMSMRETGETERIYGDYCSLIAVGSDSSENFVQEQLFGVGASGAIYEYDVYTDSWLPYNALAEIYSKSEDSQDLFAIICEPNGNELDYIHTNGRMEELVISDPGLYSDTPMILLPLKNNVNIKVELIYYSVNGGIESETVLYDLDLSRGDMCTIYGKMTYDTSPLLILATWQDGPSEFNGIWWAVSGVEYGEVYISYARRSRL